MTVIPVKVLADYQVPARPNCTDPDLDTSSQHIVFGTDGMVAAGIDYVTGLAQKGFKPIVINMSLGDTVAAPIDRGGDQPRHRGRRHRRCVGGQRRRGGHGLARRRTRR